MRKTVISALALLIVVAIGVAALNDAQARPICVTKRIDTGCCVAVGWVWAYYCCVAPGGEYLDCEWRIIRDNKACPPGSPLC